MKWMLKLKERAIAVFALLVMMIFAGCGAPEDDSGSLYAAEDESPIKIAIIKSDATGDLVTIAARSSRSIKSGSFEYCAGNASDCPAGSPNRRALMPLASVSTEPTTSAFHVISETIDLRQVARLTFFVLDSDGTSVISATVAFQRRDQVGQGQFAYDNKQLTRSPKFLKGFEYDYAFALDNIQATNPRIRLTIGNSAVSSLGGRLGVVLSGVDLSDSAKTTFSSATVSLESPGVVTVTGQNFNPGSVHEVRLHFFEIGERGADGQIAARYVGSSDRTYTFATDRADDAVATARAKIATRGLAEANDWALGRYDRSKGYTTAPGGWCVMFYQWVVKPYLANGYVFNEGYWSRVNGYLIPSAEVAMAAKEGVMGDYWRMPGHTGMVLTYDVARQRFVTLEGNMNSRVQIYRRAHTELTWVGHIRAGVLR